MMAEPRILIVEDESKLLERLSQIFHEDGFSVSSCASFIEFENALNRPSQLFDVIVMDRLLQGRDSAELMKRISEELPDVKVLVLSAINTSAEKASLLNSGADDYVAKPFDGEELVARVRVLLRRSRPEVKLGNVLLNSENRTMLIDEHDVPLTNKEFIFLRTLIKTPGKIYNKAFLYERVWEMSPEVDSNVVETTVNKLRRRLEDANASIQIKNSRNVGYWVEE